MKPIYLSQMIALIFSGAAYAHDHAAHNHGQPVVDLKAVEVTGERALPGTAVINREDLDKAAAQNIDDIVLYEPGVGVRTNPLQGGHENFNIRGLDGNRILMTLDGIPLPLQHADMGPTAGTPAVNRDTVETDTVKRVRIAKNGNAAAEGGGALGGTVAMSTFHPLDLLPNGKPFHFGVKYGYRSTYRSHGATASLAGQKGMFSGLLMLTRRNSHEGKTFNEEDKTGEFRTAANLQDIVSYNVLAKAHLSSGAHDAGLTFEYFNRDTDTERREQQGAGTSRGRPRLVPVSNAGDEYRRMRSAFKYLYTPENSVLNSLAVNAYRQNFNVINRSHNHVEVVVNPTTTNKQTKTDYKTFNQNTTGFGVDGDFITKFGKVDNYTRVGVSFQHKSGDRLQLQDVVTNGKESAGGMRLFPAYTRQTLSVYGENRLLFPNKTKLSLGLRHEYEQTKFHNDEIFKATSGGQTVPNAPGRHIWLPSAQLELPLGKYLTASAKYSRGYRPVPIDDMAAGFNNSTPYYKYRVIPNLDLKPETSNNYEVGLSWRSARSLVALTAFSNHYKDFIQTAQREQKAEDGATIFYQKNFDRVRTLGAELAAAWSLTPQWSLSGKMAWIRGKNTSLDSYLSRIYPLNGNIGVEYKAAKWGGGTYLRWSTRHKYSPTAPKGQEYFRAPGYGVIDMHAYYRPSKNISLNAGIYNVTNKRYWNYAEVSGVRVDGRRRELLDRYTQPGRNFSLGLNVKF